MKNLKVTLCILVAFITIISCSKDDGPEIEKTPEVATPEVPTPEVAAKVTSATLGSVDGFEGPCAKTFDFEAEIKVDGPMTVKYTWLRSDSATSPEETLEFEEAGTKTVSTAWTLGGSGGSFEGNWQQLKIISPNEMLSNKAEFDLHCDEETVAITATTTAVGEDDFTGECPKKFDFESEIEVSGPTTVKYTWLRSDGATSPEETLEFEEAGTNTVTKSWTLGASGDSYEGYWQQLKIIAPHEMLSNKAEFNLHCDEETVAIIATASVTGEDDFTGECPKKFDFEGIIEATGATTVRYTWLRSDGATSPEVTLVFEGAGTKTVTKSWTLGGSGSSYEGYWQQLKVIAPTEVLSNKAEFDLQCDEEMVTITANASVIGEDDFTGECPKKFDFEGIIEASGPTTVKYTWLRSDGATSPEVTLVFDGAGTKTVTRSWTLGGSGNSYEGYWRQLKIIAPQEILSNKAEFDLHCDEEIVRITATVFDLEENNYIGECPKKLEFEGEIEAYGPATVKYTWLRSDGATSPVKTLVFTGPGTKFLTNSWTIGTNGSSYEGWQQLKIISPMEVLSNKVEFNLQCIVEHSIGPIQMNPAPGITLRTGTKVHFQYIYKTNVPSGVKIWGRPFTDGSLTPNQAISPSQIHPPDENGIGSGYFTVNSEIEVDQIRFQMWNADKTELLYEIFVDADYRFKS